MSFTEIQDNSVDADKEASVFEPVTSILDKVMAVQQEREVTNFQPHEALINALQTLSEKERHILLDRYNLHGKGKRTLEDIGAGLQVTRERVRQIEKNAINKLLELIANTEEHELAAVNRVIIKIIEEHGGMMAEHHLIAHLLGLAASSALHEPALNFFLSNVMAEHLEKSEAMEGLRPVCLLKGASLETPKKVIAHAVAVVCEIKEPLTETDLVSRLNALDEIASLALTEKLMVAYFHMSADLKQNSFGAWGMAHWPTITPKRMMDKIFLVLQKEGKPLHFTTITELINQAKFDRKVAHHATIHNELILDERFVLVGKGTYALKAWGYKPGTVKEVIAQILMESQTSLSKAEILKEVMTQRMVAESTVNLALMNKTLFTKDDDGRYVLVNTGNQDQ